MEFEYDEDKSKSNFAKHGVDFDHAVQMFAGNYIESEDRRFAYGERRYSAIGPVYGRLYVIVYTWRSGRRRIISARKANRREENAYRQEITRSGRA